MFPVYLVDKAFQSVRSRLLPPLFDSGLLLGLRICILVAYPVPFLASCNTRRFRILKLLQLAQVIPFRFPFCSVLCNEI